VDVVEYAGSLGSASLQIGVDGWEPTLAREVRRRCDSLGMELEGQIELPGDLERFERDLLAGKEAGASIFRCYCLLQRRYEHFPSRVAWEQWQEAAIATLQRVEPILAKHQVRLAVENHKDWCAAEQAEVFRRLSSEWIGICLDYGNNLALLEDPLATAQTLAPWILTTHVKDMAVRQSPDGFLLSEVPLGRGILDLSALTRICREANPRVRFLLEMITRDPLPIPWLTDSYWATFSADDRDFRRHRAQEWGLRGGATTSDLPHESLLTDAEALRLEERFIRESFRFWGSQEAPATTHHHS
jgi:sugar phosphate isomerase/epimerase